MTEKTRIPLAPARRSVLRAGAAALPLAFLRPAHAATAPLTEAQAARVVSIGGAVTETLYALGLGSRIVAVDTTSLFPPEAMREKQSVGYMRALAAEGVLSVGPSAILMLEGSGPPAALEVLARTGIPVITVEGAPTPQGVVGRVRMLAALFGVDSVGTPLAQRIEAGFAALAAARQAVTAPPVRVMFVLSMRNGRPLAAGRDTAADAMITLAGGRNVMGAVSGYKAVTDEAVIEAAPELVLTMTGGEDDSKGGGTAGAVLAAPVFRATPAVAHKAVVAMDGETLLGFGPRTPTVALDLLHRLAAIAAAR